MSLRYAALKTALSAYLSVFCSFFQEFRVKGELPVNRILLQSGSRQHKTPMLFDEMNQIARNIASQRLSNNMPLSFNDTICVVYTTSGKIYVGVSAVKTVNNMPMMCHAEMEVCNNLVSENDTAIAEISVFNAGNFQPVLPCPDCAARIVGLNPHNAGTLILLPTQNVVLSQLGAFVQSQQNPQMPMGQAVPPAGGYQGMPVNQYQGMPPQMGQYQSPPVNQYYGMPQQNMSQYQAMPQQNMSQYQAMPQQQYAPPVQPQTQSRYIASEHVTSSVYLSGEDTDSGSYLKGRLNKLFDVEDEPDLEDLKAKKAAEKAASKKKFKLF